VRGWWSYDIQGDTAKLNDEFVFEVKGVHRSKQKLVEVIPDRKVVWLVTEADMSFIKQRDEWKDTRVVFEIEKQAEKTQLHFTHEGLVSSIECYGACSPAWTQYIRHSLFDLITTGKGDPNLEGRNIEEIAPSA
jgi:Activator of Hsp90 ATPase homolog 1-like protein